MKRNAFLSRPLLLSLGVVLGAIAPTLFAAHTFASNTFAINSAASPITESASAASPSAESPITESASVESKQQDAGVRVELERNQLHLIAYGETMTLTPDDFEVRVLDAVDCALLRLEPEQRMQGQMFFETVAVDPQTGNVAVGVLLDECVGTQVSAVFVLDPQPGAYTLYRVSVPGDRALPDEFSTFPLDSILNLGYFGNQLLIQQGDASGTTSLLVFSVDEHPAGSYRGCVVTEFVEGNDPCPPEDAVIPPFHRSR